MSEFALLESLRPRVAGTGPGVPLGFGDDAAIVEVGGAPVAVAVDVLVDGIHFDLTISSLADVGWKAVAANVSDLGAIAATPVAAVIGLQRPDDLGDAGVHALYDGIIEAADRWDVRVVGGDVVAAPALAVAITLLGEPATGHHLVRGAAHPDDVVVVAGPIGLPAAGLALARAGAHDLLERHPQLLAAHRRPIALPGAGVAAARAGAQAGIDVSDGLGRDLGHIARASGVRIELDAAVVPIDPGVRAAAEHLGLDALDLALGGGDDLALALTVAPDRLDAVAGAVAGAGAEPVVVGRVVAGESVVLRTDEGERDVSTLGWEHGRLGGGDQEGPA